MQYARSVTFTLAIVLSISCFTATGVQAEGKCKEGQYVRVDSVKLGTKCQKFDYKNEACFTGCSSCLKDLKCKSCDPSTGCLSCPKGYWKARIPQAYLAVNGQPYLSVCLPAANCVKTGTTGCSTCDPGNYPGYIDSKYIPDLIKKKKYPSVVFQIGPGGRNLGYQCYPCSELGCPADAMCCSDMAVGCKKCPKGYTLGHEKVTEHFNSGYQSCSVAGTETTATIAG